MGIIHLKSVSTQPGTDHAGVFGVGEGHLFHHRKARRLVSEDFAKLGSLFQSFPKGEHSGRMYNPDKAGGPTQDLDWTTASVTQEGIDLVKLHTGRFDPSDANKIMIDRLEKILSGQISITDIDKRFYTHEIRELERYRTQGFTDGVNPKNDPIWNNAHTATLEDYKLKDGFDLFYTQEALAADNAQVERENK